MSIVYKQINNPWFLEHDNNGLPAAGYRIWVFSAGSVPSPATMVDTYSEHTLTTKNPNPVVLNSRGQANIFANQALLLVYTAPADDYTSPIWTEDYVGEQQGTPALLGGIATSDGHNNYSAASSPVLSALFDQLTVIVTPNADSKATIGTTAFTGPGINDCTFSGPYTGTDSGSHMSVTIDGANFQGAGLNDAVWGGTPLLGHVYTVKISTAAATDKFQWRKDGGAWSAEISMTGAAQALADGVTITFAATTGHTLADLWNNVDTFSWQKDGGTVTAGVAITAALQILGGEGVGVTFAEKTGHTLAENWTVSLETPVRFTFCGLGGTPKPLVYRIIDGVLTALGEKDLKQDVPVEFIYSQTLNAYVIPGPSQSTPAIQKPFRERVELIGAYTIQGSDIGKELSCAGTWALTWPACATLPNHWWWIRNSGSGTITLTANGTEKFKFSALLAGASTLALYPGQMVMITNNGVELHVAGYDLGGLVKITYLTAGVSFTTQSTTRNILVKLLGSGGGGGSVANTANSQAGGGGGSGGYAEKFFAVSPSTAYTYAIGAAAAADTDGNNTTFTVGATTVTAPGGKKGSPGVDDTIVPGGAGSATPTNGDLNAVGNPGFPGLVWPTDNLNVGGTGGCSPYGGGGMPGIGGVGQAAVGYGAGGGGASTSGAGPFAGGASSQGLIIVMEFA